MKVGKSDDGEDDLEPQAKRTETYYDENCFDLCGLTETLNEGSEDDVDEDSKKDEEDEELRALREKAENFRQILALRWQVMESIEGCDVEIDIQSCGESCKVCHSEGAVNCRFCGGTGFLTVGRKFYGMGQKCPVCSDGEEQCRACMGNGFVAAWRRNPPG